MDEQTFDAQKFLAQASGIDKQGYPIDWQKVAYLMGGHLQVAEQEIGQLTQQLGDLEATVGGDSDGAL